MTHTVLADHSRHGEVAVHLDAGHRQGAGQPRGEQPGANARPGRPEAARAPSTRPPRCRSNRRRTWPITGPAYQLVLAPKAASASDRRPRRPSPSTPPPACPSGCRSSPGVRSRCRPSISASRNSTSALEPRSCSPSPRLRAPPSRPPAPAPPSRRPILRHPAGPDIAFGAGHHAAVDPALPVGTTKLGKPTVVGKGWTTVYVYHGVQVSGQYDEPFPGGDPAAQQRRAPVQHRPGQRATSSQRQRRSRSGQPERTAGGGFRRLRSPWPQNRSRPTSQTRRQPQ